MTRLYQLWSQVLLLGEGSTYITVLSESPLLTSQAVPLKGGFQWLTTLSSKKPAWTDGVLQMVLL